MKISHFRLDRNKKINELRKDLINFMEKFVNNKSLLLLIKKFSYDHNLSLKNVKFEIKQLLFKSFINKEGSFNNKFNFINIFKSSLIFFFYLLYVIFFSKNKINKPLRCDLIIDNITRGSNVKKLEILNEKKKLIFISDHKINIKKFNVYVFNFRGCIIKNKSNFVLKNLKYYFKFLRLSFFTKNNLIPMVYHLSKICLKYNTIFSEVKSKYLLQERFYDTSAIRDDLFHRSGGKYSSCIQKNLFQINGTGMFVFTDVLFTLGKKSILYDKEMGCEIKKKVPVGSLNFERDKIKNKRINLKTYDILVFASEHIANFHSGYNSYYKEYYEHFRWIKKIAQSYPNLKICIKHKKSFNDTIENSILSNIPNIDYVIDENDDYSLSYILGKKAKALFTWSSTLGFELIGDGKECYFLDPFNSNYAFMPKNDLNDAVRITTYNDFEKRALKLIKGKKNLKLLSKKKDYCLSSYNVSKNIINFFKL